MRTMNVVQGKRKRTAAQRNRDYQDFNRINPVGADPINKILDNQSNNVSFTTLATRGNSVGRQSSTYLSITSGRGYAHGEVGIAYIDIESPTLKLIQLSDDPWYSALLMKIHIIDPCHIIVPHTIYDAKSETSDGKLIKFIREEFPKLGLIKVPRRHFNEADGMELVQQHCSQKYNFVMEDINSKYYALSAASGLLKYLQYIHNIHFKENGLKLDCETKFAHMQIDIDTSYKLELLAQGNPNMVKSGFPSLYGMLDSCVTSLGKRTLRARILEPMCDISSIKEIQDCIIELNQAENIELSPSLTHVLSNFNNIERLHKLVLVVPQDDNIRAAEILINQALHLKKCLQLIPVLQGRLTPLMSTKFQEIQANLMDKRYTSILNQIDTVINKNLLEFQRDSNSQLFQKIHCVQNGVNDLVDILRKSYSELIGQIETLVGDMSAKYGHAFKLNYTVQRGFHVQLPIEHNVVMREFPDELEILEIKRNTCFLTTPDINKYNIRIRNVIEEIIIQSNVVIAAMLNGIIREIDAIYDLSAFTATLDIILSFAKVSNNECFVCPTFGDEMRIVDAVHPLLEQSIHQTVPTPNNIIATPEYNFFIITGPNMSGKTVYLKMIAILQIMAQLGCFVPAKCAQFRITDRMFSRMGFNDSIEKNLSTFMTEMNSVEHILKNVTPNSLVIIDELCRSTNPKEGSQLAWNICEYLASIRGIFNDGKYFVNSEQMHFDVDENVPTDDASLRESVAVSDRISTAARSLKNSKLCVITAPFIFLTTHFHSLTKLATPFFNVVNLHFSLEQTTEDAGEHSGQTLKYNHRIQEGVITTTSYGLAVAKTLRFTSDLLNQAIELNQHFISGENNQHLIEGARKRKLSSLSRQMLQTNRLQIGRIDDMASVVSSAMNASRRRRRFATHQDNFSGASGTTLSSVYDDQMKIDRVFYNAYGDIMSLARSAELDWMNHYNDEENVGIGLEEAQNDAITPFLMQFVQEQDEVLIEAVVNLNLSQEMPEPSEENNSLQTRQRDNVPMNTTAVAKVEESDMDTSSVISIQRVVAPRSIKKPLKTQNVTNSKAFMVVTRETIERVAPSPKTLTNTSLQTPPRSFLMFGNSIAVDLFQDTPSVSSICNFIPSSGSSSSAYLSLSPDGNHNIQNSQFDNFQINTNYTQSPPNGDFGGSLIDSTAFGLFNQPSMRSQSQNDLFDEPNNTGFWNSHFSLHDINVTSESSQISSQSHRPNLGNIQRVARASRSVINLPLASRPESNVSTPKTGKCTPNSTAFHSSSSIRSGFEFFNSDKSKRRMPLIQKSKLNTSSVFASTSNLFSTQSEKSAELASIPKQPPKQAPAQNRLERSFDSSFTAAMELLKKKCTRIMASVTHGNNTAQQTTTKQSNQNDTSDEVFMLPPPSGFD